MEVVMKKSWKGWTFTAVVFITASIMVFLKLNIPMGYVYIIAILEGGIAGLGIAKVMKNGEA
jgi:hypothetical protein